MNVTQDTINTFLDRYITFVDHISSTYHYEENTRHLLYLIVPAFVVKYGVHYETMILHSFENVRIYIQEKENSNITASFYRSLLKNDQGYLTEKYIILHRYHQVSLPELIDNIVHEFNHAINSYYHEISYDEKLIRLRTGLSYLIYDRHSLQFLSKSSEVALEETINTVQTEEIVNIIYSWSKYSIENISFRNTLFALQHEISERYVSNAYSYQTYLCNLLMKNKTFTPTIAQLRLKGLIEDIPHLFDDVVGRSGSYNKMNKLLEEIYELLIRYAKARFFKGFLLRKIKKKSQEVLFFIQEYDRKCIYK